MKMITSISLISVETAMNSNIVSSLEKSLSVLKLKISTDEVAAYMIETEFSDKQMQAVSDVFA